MSLHTEQTQNITYPTLKKILSKDDLQLKVLMIVLS